MRAAVLVGSITGWGAGFQCDVDAGSCWRSRPSKRQRPPKQERRRVGIAVLYGIVRIVSSDGCLHRGIAYSDAPARHTLAAPHERLATTWQAAARYRVQAPAFVKRHSHLAASRFCRGPHTALAHHVRCAPVVRCCSKLRARSAPAAPQSSVSRRPSAGFDRSN